jgi:hypothetical protein
LHTENAPRKLMRFARTFNGNRVAIRVSGSSMVHESASYGLPSRAFFAFHPVGTTLFLVALIGCGSSDGLNRQAITGTVSLDGLPIARGAILFEQATQASGTAVGATIQQGTFAISRQEGPVPGDYLVRVYSSSETQARPADGQTDRSPRPMVERFPPRYNTQTELRARVLDRSVNRFRFDLNSDDSTAWR